MLIVRPRPHSKRPGLEYAQRSLNPATNKPFSEAEACAFMKSQGLRAFQDARSACGAHPARTVPTSARNCTKGAYLFSHDSWKPGIDYHANGRCDGVLHRQMGPEVGVERDINSFLCASHLRLGPRRRRRHPVVAAAYFEGDVASLERKVDGRKPDGKGTGKRLAGPSGGQELKLANKLMGKSCGRERLRRRAPLHPPCAPTRARPDARRRAARDRRLPPEGPGPFPAVLVRLPGATAGCRSIADAFVARGYALPSLPPPASSVPRASRSRLWE